MTCITKPVAAKPVVVFALLAGVIAGAAIAAPMSEAAPLQPSRGTVPPGALERVLEEASSLPRLQGEWEDNAKRDEDAARLDQQREQQMMLGISDNNDTCHYTRGQTLVVHVFINHSSGTWTTAEMDNAAAKADAAKNNYMTFAPWPANQRFDPVGAYIYYNISVDYHIADSGCSEVVMEDAAEACGFGDWDGDGSCIDEMTHYLQGWGGGWDNVIVVFEPDITGRAWASYGQGKTVLYTSSTWAVWAHEWGHLFGACDEYAESGSCNGGINCGACQSTYLTETVSNGNCELMACGTTVDCLMKYNTTNAFCSDTPRHWAWADDDADGLGNLVRRPTVIQSGTQQYANIYELYHNGWFVWNDVAHSEVISQRWASWGVIGLRSPATADYDLEVYSDNTHNVFLGSSAWGTGQVDFVVGDYNHNNIGNEHIQLVRYSGSTDYYNLTFESGGEVLYPDGIARSSGWGWNNTAVIWDVPLYAGETIDFYLDAMGNIDYGMALYKSNSATYFSGRGAGQVAYIDSHGIGGDETFTYTVPANDVYGLVIWSNNSADAAFSIQIGPAPTNMAEETIYWDTYDPSLWKFTPNASQYWAVIGTRSDVGRDLSLRLYDDPNYQYLFENSFEHVASQPEWVAVDYNHAPFNTEYARVSAPGAPGWYFTEWEGDADILSAPAYPPAWPNEKVVKVWDAWMNAGTQYFFRQFSGGLTLDGALYLYNSSDGDYYKSRSEFTNVSDFLPPSYGGEWFWHNAVNTDWYGVVASSHNYTQGSYSLWFGPWIYPSEDVPVTKNEPVVWASAPPTSDFWHVAGVRPAPGEQAAIWLYEDNTFKDAGFRAYDAGSGCRFVVADYNHITPPPYYTLAQRQTGFGPLDLSWEGGTESIIFQRGGVSVPGLPWQAGNVAKVFDLYIDGAASPGGRRCRITARDDTGTLNLGVALFASNGGQGYSGSTGALAYADAGSVGQFETIEFTVNQSDWYGLVIFNQTDAAGTYSIQLLDPTATDVAQDESVASGLRLESTNPFSDQATLRLSLAQEEAVDLAVYDVQGRQVQSLIRETLPAGTRVVSWNGADAGGRPAPPGIYFARLKTGSFERRMKLIKTD